MEANPMSPFTTEFDREEDGRWLAETIETPGALVHGQTREAAKLKAQAFALRVIADRIEHGEEVQEINHIAFAYAV
jgi:predicted RNase H-like HicB family nuclease